MKMYRNGNTPADAGKTFRRCFFALLSRKHPRGRGEDDSRYSHPSAKVETPPRTRGRPTTIRSGTDTGGNTPADAGKTFSYLLLVFVLRKHPRGRGEDFLLLLRRKVCTETPPRTRGRQTAVENAAPVEGNTPADAGKTFCCAS